MIRKRQVLRNAVYYDEGKLKEINTKNGYYDIGGSDQYFDGKNTTLIAATGGKDSSLFERMKKQINGYE